MGRPTSDEAHEARLILQAQQGSVRAFEALLGRHEDRVLRLLRLLGVSAQDREDVAQEVFVRVFRHLNGFKPGRSFSGWVYRITVNATHDYRRRATLRRREETPWGEGAEPLTRSPPVADQEDRLELRQRLENALERLSSRERAVFVLRELEGLDTRQVARSLGITAVTVRRHLGRARSRLQRVLSEDAGRGRRQG